MNEVIDMPDLNLTEKQFENDIEYSLLTYGGYEKGEPKAFDRVVALDTDTLISFVKATQPKSWKSMRRFTVHLPKGLLLTAFERRLNRSDCLPCFATALRTGVLLFV